MAEARASARDVGFSAPAAARCFGSGPSGGAVLLRGRGVVGEVVGAFLEGLHLDRYQRIEGAACMGQAEPGAFPFAGVGARVEAPAFEGGQALADVEAVEQRAFFHFCRS